MSCSRTQHSASDESGTSDHSIPRLKLYHWATVLLWGIVVVVFVFNVTPTAKVMWRRSHGFKSHPTDWWSRESNLRPLVYKASGLSTTPQRLLSEALLNPKSPIYNLQQTTISKFGAISKTRNVTNTWRMPPKELVWHKTHLRKDSCNIARKT